MWKCISCNISGTLLQCSCFSWFRLRLRVLWWLWWLSACKCQTRRWFNQKSFSCEFKPVDQVLWLQWRLLGFTSKSWLLEWKHSVTRPRRFSWTKVGISLVEVLNMVEKLTSGIDLHWRASLARQSSDVSWKLSWQVQFPSA